MIIPIIGKIVEFVVHPFARGALSADGVQWSSEVTTGVADTDVVVEEVAINPIAVGGGDVVVGAVMEFEFGLTAAFKALFADYAKWAASTAYALGDFVVPATHNDRIYECTTAGTSGTAEPTWPTAEGGTVADNTVTWTCRFIKDTYKWQARNKGGTWVDLHNPVTISPTTSSYAESTFSGRFAPTANFDAVPFDVQLILRCNYANQGRAKTKNSGYAGCLYKIS